MDFIKLITEALSGNGALSQIFNKLKDNSFDIKKTFSDLSPELLVPILGALNSFGNKNVYYSEKEENEQKSDFASVQASGVAPIANIADKEIVYALNQFVSARLY